jgi:hypothetical protein
MVLECGLLKACNWPIADLVLFAVASHCSNKMKAWVLRQFSEK